MTNKRHVIEVVLVLAAVAGAILTVGYSVRKSRTRDTAKPIAFERTPARLDRGRYIVEGPAHCFQCHSEVDFSKSGGQPKPRRKGAGSIFIEEGFQWLVVPNITPDVETGAGGWSDEQLARAIREGIGHDGRRLFPVMPYMNFRNMSDEDLASVIVYLRSIEPVRNVLPKTMIPDVLKGMIPPHEPVAAPVSGPDQNSAVARGRYLATLGNCVTCHSPMAKNGGPNPDLLFAGGFHLKGPWGEVTGVNITPDPSGISYYDEELFIRTLRTGHVGARPLNSIMPWSYFKNMSDDDLKAIYAFLRTVPPKQHRVDNAEPPTFCPLDGLKHGFGDRNQSE